MIAKALDVDYSFFVDEDLEADLAKEDNVTLGFVHLSGLLLLLFPSWLIWYFKKTKTRNITEHFKYVMSLQLTVWLMFILPGIALSYFAKVNGFVNKAYYLIIIGVVLAIITSIINTIQVLNNKPYKQLTFFGWKDKVTDSQ
jgi:hypothetical protein